MKQTISLAVLARDSKENAREMRKTGTVPGVVYGNAAKNTMVKCSAKELGAVYSLAGTNTLVEVALDGKKVPCLIHALSFDPVTDAFEHVDFYAVDMTKKVTTHVPVVFEGESPAVKNLGGVLLTVHSQLEVTCLPSDIPANFTVNLGTLENFHDSVTVGKLVMPKGVVAKSSPEMVIVVVQEPRKEEVIEPVVTAATAEGAAAEGAAPAEGAAAPGAPAAGKDDKAAAGKEKDKGGKK